VRAYVDTFTDECDQRTVQETLKKYSNHSRYRFATITLEGKTMLRSIGAELGKEAPDAEVIKQKVGAFFFAHRRGQSDVGQGTRQPED